MIEGPYAVDHEDNAGGVADTGQPNLVKSLCESSVLAIELSSSGTDAGCWAGDVSTGLLYGPLSLTLERSRKTDNHRFVR